MFQIDKDHPLNNAEKSNSIAKSYINKIRSSQDRNIPFELGIVEYTEILGGTVCSYTGELFDFNNPNKVPSLERINPLEGYTSSNTILVTKEANAAKCNFDIFIHNDKLTTEQKIRIMNRVIYRLKKQLKNESLVSD